MGRTRGRRARSTRGVIPWAAQRLAAPARWLWRHPRPVVGAAAIVAACWLLWGYAQRAEAFKVTQVVVPVTLGVRVPESVIGQNLWTVDVRALAASLSRSEPTLKRVRVVRRPPNTIQIEAIPRRPVAQVRVRSWYPVDAEGFVLAEGTSEAAPDLVRIIGTERGGNVLRPGELNRHDRLDLALRVLPVLRRSPSLVSRRVTELNVGDLAQLRFVLENGLEVRCGTEGELAEHLRRLQAAFGVIARQRLDVRYIDVRFDEPVLGPAA